MKRKIDMTIAPKHLQSFDIDEIGLTYNKKLLFLQTLALGASVSAAAKAIKISRATAYLHRKNDPEFKQQWEDAIETGTDKLEDTALNRALDHSDNLLMFLLKGRRPAKFADRRLTGGMDRNGNAIEYSNTERAVRLVNILAQVKDNDEIKEKMKLIGIDKAVQQK